MRIITLMLLTGLCLLSSCRHISQGPYRNYKVSNDEAIPASDLGGAPWRKAR